MTNDTYFSPKINSAHAQYLHIVVRLKTVLKDCDYGVDASNQTRDKILFHCESEYVRIKLLEIKDDFTLEKTLQIAQDCENVQLDWHH
jgi:hypothetical protein